MTTHSFNTDISCAKELDAADILKKFRSRFYIPGDIIYLNGNSLGLMCRDSETSLLRVMEEWKSMGIRGWLDAEQPWFYFAEALGQRAAELVGAGPEEVVATGTTTINLHALVSTFFKPDSERNRILADELNFPSDIYALKGQLKLKGLNPATHLIMASSPDGKTLREADIINLMSDKIGLILLSSVLFRSGQLLDMPLLTREAHKYGITIGFDCSHSVGAIPHCFDQWDIDFAVWCSYKYLNGGPGSPAFLYVNRKHFREEPHLAGWFGSIKEKQFDFSLDFQASSSAGGWQISSPMILGAAAIEGALNLFSEAGIQNIRNKSLLLTDYLVYLTDHLLAAPPYHFKVGTPRDHRFRGGHISLEQNHHAVGIYKALKSKGIIIDFRPPTTLRIAPVALYNSFQDVWETIRVIKKIIDTGEQESFSGIPDVIS